MLALSRAFGDFEFKRNSDLKLEEQVVTGLCWDNITVTSIIMLVLYIS